MNELNTIQRSNYINRQDIEWAHQQDEVKLKQQFYSATIIISAALIILSWCWMFYQKITA
jgi:hypothetical protein